MTTAETTGTPYTQADIPPMRARGDEPDGFDPERLELVKHRWHAQDTAYLGFSKTVEEHIRMLSGRQWDRWSGVYGRFVDVLQFMSDDEKKYRMRPVMDYLLYWYVLTLAKVTENPSTISFQPSTSDHLDAMLAEVLDPVWKTLFHEMQMDQRRIRMAAWQLVAGEGYYHTRVDFTAGPKRQLIAPAELTLDRPGKAPITRTADAVPYDKTGTPLAKLVEDPNDPDNPGYDVTGEPYEDMQGQPSVDVLCPLQVRAQWGQHIAWRDKRWIMVESFLTPSQIAEQMGARVDPDHYIADDSAGGPGYLERMLFGTGYFGASMEASMGAVGALNMQSVAEQARQAEGFCRVLTMWEKPIAGFSDESDENAGGRLLIVAPGSDTVLWDSHRPYRTACAGPIRRAAFIDIPGRPQGTTPLERMVPLQRRLNRVEAHIAQHTNLCTDPILMVHEAAGIDDDEFVAKPGLVITHGYNGQGQAAYFLQPPPLSEDVWKHKNDVREQLFVIGSMVGNQSAPPTASASGELVQQLRTNADRPLTPLTTNLVIAEGEVAEDLLAILPVIWTDEQLISYAGQDNVIRVVKVTPEMLDGSVHVIPSVESAAPESREAKQARMLNYYQLGIFGDITPGSPEAAGARKQLMELMNFPDMTRATRPGGIDRVMAEHIVGQLVRGVAAGDIPILEVYDLGIHRMVVENEMKSPEYLTFDPPIQAEFVKFRAMIIAAMQAQAMNKIQEQLPVAQAQAAATGTVATTQQMASPQPPTAPGKPGASAPPPVAPSGPPGGGAAPPAPAHAAA